MQPSDPPAASAALWPSRRSWLLSVAAISLAPLSACRQRAAPTCKGLDLTLAAYEWIFSLPDADGATRSLEDFGARP